MDTHLPTPDELGGPAQPEGVLFDLGGPLPAPRPAAGGTPRLRHANREQAEMRCCSLDQLVDPDHEVRQVWAYVDGLDLSAVLAGIRAVEGGPGASATDPRILFALWLYAVLRKIGSARELDRRAREDFPFQWLRGGVSLNYHTLADFRVAHGDVLDGLLTRSVAVLLEQELVTMDRVAQDGMRVRAAAGASSFRREPRLQEFLEEAEHQVESLRKELEEDPAAGTKRQRAARQRAAEDRVERVRKAIERLPEAAACKAAKDQDKARVSTTDAEAKVMKMGDGGFRPALNVQFATDTETQLIVGVDVVGTGSDQGQLAPMASQLEDRYGEKPAEMLVDGGYTKKEDIEALGQEGTTVYAPVPKPKDEARDPHEPLASDSPEVAEWRRRMGTAEAKAIYRERASTAECVNAQARNRGLQQFTVRGRAKARAVVLWYVLAHNLVRTAALRAAREKEAVQAG